MLKEKARMNISSFSRTDFRKFKREKEKRSENLKLISISFIILIHYFNYCRNIGTVQHTLTVILLLSPVSSLCIFKNRRYTGFMWHVAHDGAGFWQEPGDDVGMKFMENCS